MDTKDKLIYEIEHKIMHLLGRIEDHKIALAGLYEDIQEYNALDCKYNHEILEYRHMIEELKKIV